MNELINWIKNIDQFANQWVQSIRSPELTKIMYFFTSIGKFYPMVIMSIILFTILILKRKKEYIASFFAAMPGGYALLSLMKYLIGRPRPPDALFKVPGYSFPSGHAMMSTIFFLFILKVFSSDFKSSFFRTIFIILTITFPIAISFSRLYFNVHWLSDIVGGIIIGIFWLSLSLSIRQ